MLDLEKAVARFFLMAIQLLLGWWKTKSWYEYFKNGATEITKLRSIHPSISFQLLRGFPNASNRETNFMIFNRHIGATFKKGPRENTSRYTDWFIGILVLVYRDLWGFLTHQHIHGVVRVDQEVFQISLPVSLWLFGAHVGVGRLLGDKDTANLAQLLVHLKGWAESSLMHRYKRNADG